MATTLKATFHRGFFSLNGVRHTSGTCAARMAETSHLAASFPGALQLPPAPHGVIVMATEVADDDDVLRHTLHDAQLATLQIEHAGANGTTPAGTHARELTKQLLSAAEWIGRRPELSGLPLGIFGTLEGGGAALAAAATRPEQFRALVLRDPGPPVPGIMLSGVLAATLLIADGQDDEALALNQETMARVRCIAELELLSGTAVSYDDPATMAQVARLARRWFERFLV